MELNVETAVRICPVGCTTSDMVCVQANTINSTIQLANAQNYPVNHPLPINCCQNTVFTTAVAPLVNYLVEGCDVSVVTFGQSSTGKSYTLFGPGFHCASSEAEHGVIPRFIREIFTKIKQYRDRNWSVHITWSQICGENIQDLLGVGSVECSNISDVFQLIQLGMSNIAKCAHTLFTLTLEQQWIVDSMVQHRVSTASFADLAGSEKVLVYDSNGMMQTIPTDLGMQTLQRCVMSLSESCNHFVPYTQSVLTTLLKDSFGGRAKTLFLCCVSPLIQDFTETLYTLQLAMRVQMIKNFVTVNSYTTFESIQDNCDVFGLQFAANQLLKLVSNAEELFQRLVSKEFLPKGEQERISQWLMLKQECEDCLSETSEPHRSLERIEEEIESESSESEPEEEEKETETLIDKVQVLMEEFRIGTDKLVAEVASANVAVNSCTKESISSSNNEYRLKGARGRRGSIHSAEEFHSVLSLKSEESAKDVKIKQEEVENGLLSSKKQIEKLKKLKEKQKEKLKSSKGSCASRKSQTPDKAVALLKSNSLSSVSSDELECLRHEIRKLRKTRDYLLELRCKIDAQSQNQKILNESDERKLLQYEEAVEAIDLIMEYKNSILCGHHPLRDLEESSDRMLMERFLKLSENEMRILLHKYFEKIIDLRGSSKKLEVQILDIENKHEKLAYYVLNLRHNLQLERSDAERKIASLQQQHEDKLYTMVKTLTNGNEKVSRAMASRHSAVTVQVAETSKQVDENRMIARITRYRQETVPRQMQAAAQAKVTIEKSKNKLILQKTKKS